jgi:hypothetical protein
MKLYNKHTTKRKKVSMSGYELKLGKGNMFMNEPKKDSDKHDYYGTISMPRDVKAGEQIKLHGYKNMADSGRKYIGFQVLDKREDDL